MSVTSASARTVAATTPSITGTLNCRPSGSANRAIAAQPNTIERLPSVPRACSHNSLIGSTVVGSAANRNTGISQA